jgi:hypothetical protein
MGSNDQSSIIAVALNFSNNAKAALIRAVGAPGTEAAENGHTCSVPERARIAAETEEFNTWYKGGTRTDYHPL